MFLVTSADSKGIDEVSAASLKDCRVGMGGEERNKDAAEEAAGAEADGVDFVGGSDRGRDDDVRCHVDGLERRLLELLRIAFFCPNRILRYC